MDSDGRVMDSDGDHPTPLRSKDIQQYSPSQQHSLPTIIYHLSSPGLPPHPNIHPIAIGWEEIGKRDDGIGGGGDER